MANLHINALERFPDIPAVMTRYTRVYRAREIDNKVLLEGDTHIAKALPQKGWLILSKGIGDQRKTHQLAFQVL